MSSLVKSCCIEKISLFHSCNDCGIAVYEFQLSCGHKVDYNYAIDDKVRASDILGNYCRCCGKMIVGSRV